MRTVTADAHMIVLGRTGETEALQVLFPVAEKWAATYGNGVFQLLVLRPGDVSPYAVPIVEDGPNVVWTVTSTETARAGYGKAELSYYVGDTLAKSLVWQTQVLESLSPAPQDPPAPWQSWVDEVLKAGADAKYYAGVAEMAASEDGIFICDVNEEDGLLYFTVSDTINESYTFAINDNTGELEVIVA